jgi:lipopolysaccharide transport system ATP-binding protein
MSFAVSIENISKRYRLGEINRGQILADIHRWWIRRKANTRTLPDDAEPAEKGDFWALKNISFEIGQGETLAIIGANGAGKSTLLKIISRITAPTTGRVRIKGRIGSLLEVGTGFHPELTGRDNVFLNGAILGMNRGEVRTKFDDIVDFAGLEQFIDTPVKRYSSGMYVRLAFSVAAFLEPEILIIDEVLSVGDQQFQDKCMQRIEEIVRSGRTLLFVSHGAGLVQRVCRRAILLRQGTVVFDGDVEKAFEAYAGPQTPPATDPPPSEQAASEAPPAVGEPTPTDQAPATGEPIATAPPEIEPIREPPVPPCAQEWPDLDGAPGDDIVKFRAVRILDSEGSLAESLLTTQSANIEIEFVVLRGGKYLQPTVLLKDNAGNAVFWSSEPNPELRRTPMGEGKYKSSMLIPADFLAPGTIYVSMGIPQIAGGFETHALAIDAVSFQVADDFSQDSVRCGYEGPIPGPIRPRMKWTTERLDGEE